MAADACPGAAANSFSEQDAIQFDFEEAISREEAERQRVLESQGGVSSQRFLYNVNGLPQSGSATEKESKNGKRDNVSSALSSSFSQRERSIVCRHWIRGMCWKGDFCEFLHQYDTDKMPLCRQFQKTGYCADKERGCCIFLHESPRTNEDTPLCIHYFLGFCRSGPRCRKRHQRLDIDSIPLLVPDWYLHLILANARNVIPMEMDPETEKVMAEVELLCRKLSGTTGTTAAAMDKGGPNSSSRLTGKASVSSSQNVGSKHIPQGNALAAVDARQLSDFPTENDLGANSTQTNSNIRPRDVRLGVTPPASVIDADVVRCAEERGIPRLPGSSSAAEQAGKTRIFMIKSSDIANIHTSIRLGVWATGKKNTRLLEQAFQTNQHVILLFSGNETGGFQGYARMVTPTISGLYSNIWGNFSVRLGNNFRVHWLKQCKVEFEKFGSLVNPLNAHQSIRKSRDCQEVPLREAAIICTVLDREPDVDLLSGVEEAKDKPRIDHSSFFALSEAERVEKEIELKLRDSSATVVEQTAQRDSFLAPQQVTPNQEKRVLSVKPFATGSDTSITYTHPRPPPPPPPLPDTTKSSDFLGNNCNEASFSDNPNPSFAYGLSEGHVNYGSNYTSRSLAVARGLRSEHPPGYAATVPVHGDYQHAVQPFSAYPSQSIPATNYHWKSRASPYLPYSNFALDTSSAQLAYFYYGPWPSERRSSAYGVPGGFRNAAPYSNPNTSRR